MRSTFIEDHLIKRNDIFLLAKIACHDVKTFLKITLKYTCLPPTLVQ